MLIVGACRAAKELLEVLYQLELTENLIFFDDVNKKIPATISNNFSLMRSMTEVTELFVHDKNFILGIGSPNNREIMANKFYQMGGDMPSIISPKAEIGHYGTKIDRGVSILTGSIITTDVKIASGVFINKLCIISHDVSIGLYSVLSPGVKIMGGAIIGDKCFIGTGAIVNPNITLGNNSTVGSGAVVTKDVPKNTVVAGVPAKILK